MNVKTGIFAICISLITASCDSKPPQTTLEPAKPRWIQHRHSSSFHKKNTEPYGASYKDGNWLEASSPNIALLGAVPTLKTYDCEASDTVSFERTLISNKQFDGATLDPNYLGKMKDQHSAGTASGIIVSDISRSFLITTQHSTGLSEHAIVNYSLRSVNGHNNTLTVPCTNVIKLANCVYVSNDLQACELTKRSGLQLTRASIKPGVEVQTRIHPFGLPMKASAVTVSSCEGDHCWARFDNAAGGSGGAVLMTDETLAGMVLGTGIYAKIQCTDPEDSDSCTWKPCECSPGGSCYEESQTNHDICQHGQRFITSHAIRDALNAKFGTKF